MYDITSSQVEFVYFNKNKLYLSTKEARQAIAYGIDSEKIIKNAYASDAVLADTLYYPNFLGVAETGEYSAYNYDKAVELLEKANIRDTNDDGELEDSYGNEITLKLVVKKSNAQRASACRIIAKNLETLGFDTEVSELSKSDYNAAVASGNYDLLLAGCEMEATYDLREFFNGKNDWGYYNKDLYSKASELERLYSEKNQKSKYSDLKDALLDEMPYYALCYKKMGLVGISTFTAEQLPTFENIYKNCNTWSWKEIIKDEEEVSDAKSE